MRAVLAAVCACLLAAGAAAAGATSAPAQAHPASRPAATSADTPPGGSYRPLTGERILDTFHGVGAPRGRTRQVTVTAIGHGGIPATGVSAVMIDLIVGDPARAGSAVAIPSGVRPGGYRSVGFGANQTTAGLAVVTLDSTGRFDVNSTRAAYLYADVEGYFTDASAAGTTGLYHPITPRRLRTADDPALANGQRDVITADAHGVPAGAEAVVLDVTAFAPSRTGSLTVYPSRTPTLPRPSMYVDRSSSRSNRVVVALPASGQVTLLNNAGTNRVEVDITGYFSAGGDESGGYFVPLGTLSGTTDGPAYGYGPFHSGPNQILDHYFYSNDPNSVPRTGSVINLIATVDEVTVAPVGRGGQLALLPADLREPRTINTVFGPSTLSTALAFAGAPPDGYLHGLSRSGDIRGRHPAVSRDMIGYFAAAPAAPTASGGWLGSTRPIDIARSAMLPPDTTSIASTSGGKTSLLAAGHAYIYPTGFLSDHLPTLVTGVPTTLTSVVAITHFGASTFYGLAADQSVWTWPKPGATDDAQGEQVPSLSGITALGGGPRNVFAIRSDGRVLAWGDNSYQQLGSPTPSGSTSTPQLVPGLTDITSVVGGPQTAAATDSAGNYSVWGTIGSADGPVVVAPGDNIRTSCAGGRVGASVVTPPVVCPNGSVFTIGSDGFHRRSAVPKAAAITGAGGGLALIGTDGRLWVGAFGNDTFRRAYGMSGVRTIALDGLGGYLAATG